MNLLKHKQDGPCPVGRATACILLWGLLSVAAGSAGTNAPNERLAAAMAAALSQGRTYRAELDSLQVRLERQQDAESASHARELDRILGLAQRCDTTAVGSAEAGALYNEIVDSLREIRPRLRQALDELGAASTLPAWPVVLGDEVRGAAPFADQVRALDSLRAVAESHAAELRQFERAVRWLAVETRGERGQRLNALRIAQLSRLSSAQRREILGFSRTGIAQFRRELTQLGLSAQLYLARRGHELQQLPSSLRRFLRSGSTYRVGLKLLVLLAVSIWVGQNWRRILLWFRREIFRRVRGMREKVLVEGLLGILQVVAPWGLFLIGIHLVRRTLGPQAGLPEVDVVLQLAWIYGLYRLAIDAAYALLLRAAGRYRLPTSDTLERKIFITVRTAARLAVAIALLLQLSSLLLGEGYLYHLVILLAWVLCIAFSLRLVTAWRAEISEAYLRVSPSGRLAAAVRRTRTRRFGLFVALIAFGLIAGRALAVMARDFALEFDQTRKALAFLFRRRMEKHAEKRGYADGRLEDLPAALVGAFSEQPLRAADPAVEHFPGLEQLGRDIETWRAGRGGGAFLLTGEPGIGKTSWLARMPAADLPVVSVLLTDRPSSTAELERLLAAELLPGEPQPSHPGPLAERLASGPPRIVIVDRLQNLFLAAIGGYECLEEFISIVEATSRRVFWVCACNTFAWIHLKAVRPDLAVFRRWQNLPAWSEERIRSLIAQRLSSSGFDANYEDLVLDRMEGVSAEATLLRTEEGYTRLLWDYSDGNPRVALHCWLRSVVPDGPERVRVRLFRAPTPEELESGGESGLFILAAIVNHENLTLAEAARTTSYEPSLCRIQLDRFLECGALVVEAGRYRVTTRWQRPVIRLMRRRNLLQD